MKWQWNQLRELTRAMSFVHCIYVPSSQSFGSLPSSCILSDKSKVQHEFLTSAQYLSTLKQTKTQSIFKQSTHLPGVHQEKCCSTHKYVEVYLRPDLQYQSC